MKNELNNYITKQKSVIENSSFKTVRNRSALDLFFLENKKEERIADCT